MSKLNLINVSSAVGSLDSTKADTASVALNFDKTEKAADANSALGSLNSKVDTNSASNAKDLVNVNGKIGSLATSANNDYTSVNKTLNNLDVTNDKINALRNLMHAGGETIPKLMAMATSYEAEIGSNSNEGNSLAAAKVDKTDAAQAFSSLQSSASNHADSVANSVADSAKTALAGMSTSVVDAKNKVASNAGKITSLANENTSMKDTINQLVSALSVGSNK